MDGINQSNLIPLEDELKHAKAYVSIEILRFDNITVNFDIQYSDFKVPALTIQPLIENAIKHGVKDLDEGIINVKTFKKDNSCFIIIEDNGGGFDKEKYLKDGKNHIGLKNVIERIEMKGHGYVKIDSVIGKGTIITIEFKEGE